MTTNTKDDIARRLMLEHREHQTVYGDDRRRKALLSEAADCINAQQVEIERLNGLYILAIKGRRTFRQMWRDLRAGIKKDEEAP